MKTFNLAFLTLSFIVISCNDADMFVHDSDSSSESISCFLATNEFNITRTVIDDNGHLFWNSGDEISVFATNSDTPYRYSTTSDKDTASFYGPSLTSTDNKYWGLYPYNQNSSFSTSSHIISTVLPSQQIAVENSFDPESFISAAYSTKKYFDFKNVCGGIRFTLSQAGIKRVVFRTRNSEQFLAGTVQISIGSDGIPSSSVTNDGNSSDSIVLQCESGFKTGTLYYISTIPCKLLQGFEMSFYKSTSPENLLCTTSCLQPVEIRRSVFSTIKNADLQSEINKIKPAFDLSESGTANCYIVNRAGNFKFKATQGNSSAPIQGISSVRILWETANTLEPISTNSIIRNVNYSQDYISFSTPDILKDGNALIVAYNGDNILWSWHIWCVNGYDPLETAQQYEHFSKSPFLSSKVMMDRNLGALSESDSSPLSNGLMYQWGRKDPFMGAASRTVGSTARMYSTNPSDYIDNSDLSLGYSYSVQHPNTFITSALSVYEGGSGNWNDKTDNKLWTESGSAKSKNDPCPAGWRVPDGRNYLTFSENTNPWKISDNKYETEKFKINSEPCYLGVYFNVTVPQGQPAKRTLYPCNGYLTADDFELLMNGEASYYWSASPCGSANTVFAFRIFIDKTYNNISASSSESGKIRAEGHSVRCISEN